MLRTENITYTIDKKQILKNVNATFPAGEFNMILGPNGSGKSSFLKIFSGEISKFEGSVFYDDKKIKEIKNEELAKKRAVMSQQADLSFPLLVEEVVMMGRYPHFNFSPNKKDIRICHEAIERMNLHEFKQRNYLTLSGGEKQRVQYARVLAQIWEKPSEGYRYLFLDEPLNSLDISYQHEFLEAAVELIKDHTVLIAVMHDINLAAHYADNLFFFKEGELIVNGKPKDVLTETIIEKVFNVRTKVIDNPVTGRPLVIYN